METFKGMAGNGGALVVGEGLLLVRGEGAEVSFRERIVEAVKSIAAPFRKAKAADDDFFRLAGAWESDRSADDMVADIKAARRFKGGKEEMFR
ncbi:MAG: hypothetical protein LBB27_00215 [Tannerellaceae bacterium]|jgi:hypothetical protein|nr:hypothetical protein [Tannerellaceae bacterium]